MSDGEHLDEAGVARKNHYGAGRQPWDTIAEETDWAPAFAAANVLKYLRRTKDPAHSIESARWYHARLRAMAEAGGAPPPSRGWTRYDAARAFARLRALLTDDELERLA